MSSRNSIAIKPLYLWFNFKINSVVDHKPNKSSSIYKTLYISLNSFNLFCILNEIIALNIMKINMMYNKKLLLLTLFYYCCYCCYTFTVLLETNQDKEVLIFCWCWLLFLIIQKYFVAEWIFFIQFQLFFCFSLTIITKLFTTSRLLKSPVKI